MVTVTQQGRCNDCGECWFGYTPLFCDECQGKNIHRFGNLVPDFESFLFLESANLVRRGREKEAREFIAEEIHHLLDSNNYKKLNEIFARIQINDFGYENEYKILVDLLTHTYPARSKLHNWNRLFYMADNYLSSRTDLPSGLLCGLI